MGGLIALFSNIWFRRAALVVALLVAWFAFKEHYINEGKQIGKDQVKQEVAEQITAALKTERESTIDTLNALQSRIEASEQRAAQDRMVFLQLATQREKATQQIAGLTEAQVEAIVQKYSPRQLADCVTQYPLCQKQVESQEKELSEKDSQLQNQNKRFDSLADYTTEVESAYTQLFNLKSSPKRSWKCLRLWKCVTPKITAPDPTTLKRPIS